MVNWSLLNYLYDVLGYAEIMVHSKIRRQANVINHLAICLICVTGVTNWSQFMAIRALQGFFECTISPGFLLIIGSWYRTEEQAPRALFWQAANAFFLIVCDLIMYGIAGYAENHGSIQPWRTISLFLGSLTIALAIAAIFLLGTPKEVRWLTKRERRMAYVNSFSSFSCYIRDC